MARYVSDRGPGIPEARARRFSTTSPKSKARPAKQHQGTGLGLAICREIVSRHRGHIAFDTSWAKGSTFYFELAKLEADAWPRMNDQAGRQRGMIAARRMT
jgi:signal transduction histidine kinase